MSRQVRAPRPPRRPCRASPALAISRPLRTAIPGPPAPVDWRGSVPARSRRPRHVGPGEAAVDEHACEVEIGKCGAERFEWPEPPGRLPLQPSQIGALQHGGVDRARRQSGKPIAGVRHDEHARLRGGAPLQVRVAEHRRQRPATRERERPAVEILAARMSGTATSWYPFSECSITMTRFGALRHGRPERSSASTRDVRRRRWPAPRPQARAERRRSAPRGSHPSPATGEPVVRADLRCPRRDVYAARSRVRSCRCLRLARAASARRRCGQHPAGYCPPAGHVRRPLRDRHLARELRVVLEEASSCLPAPRRSAAPSR